MSPQPGRPPRVLLVDDHPAFREGLALLLEQQEVATCIQAGKRTEALARLDEGAVRLALVDLSLGEDDGLALVADLRRREVPVLVCSLHEEPRYVKQALAAGARGYLTKREAPQELVRAIRDVLAGWVLVSPRAADDLD